MKLLAMTTGAVLLVSSGAALSVAVAQQAAEKKTMSADAKRGRYLVQIAGCNDCHTPGYAPAGGKVEEKLWLTGDQLGYRGPWGTTYPSNLRLLVKDMTADQFVKHARSEFRRRCLGSTCAT